MTMSYGLRNTATGRILRISETSSFMKPSIWTLTEDGGDPVWKVDRLSFLITTWAENATDTGSTHVTPAWGSLNLRDPGYQPVCFRTTCEYDVEGGDPVSRTEWLQTFSLDNVYDLRGDVYRTRPMDQLHYSVLQAVFARYDMDRHDDMTVALVPHLPDSPTNILVGDIGLTKDRGPARIIEVAPLPEDWPLSSEQSEHKPFPDPKWSLLLLDASALESWLDLDQIDVDTSLTRSAA